MNDFRYILRYYIDPGYCENERIAELVDFCQNSCIKEVMLFFNPEEVNNGHITLEELARFIPAFLQDGMVNDRLVTLPVAKSTELMFINQTAYDRFTADTGIENLPCHSEGA